MYRTIARITQVAGQLTVVVAFIVLIWTIADLAGSNEQGPAGTAVIYGPNQYVQAVATSAGLAVSGMIALGLGMMLERFCDA